MCETVCVSGVWYHIIKEVGTLIQEIICKHHDSAKDNICLNLQSSFYIIM